VRPDLTPGALAAEPEERDQRLRVEELSALSREHGLRHGDAHEQEVLVVVGHETIAVGRGEVPGEVQMHQL
jgi:hypothetical protein